MITPSQKLFQTRKRENNDKNVITFTRNYNPNHQFSFNNFKNCIKNTTSRELQKAFNDKKILLSARQQKKPKNLLVRSKFETKTIPESPKQDHFYVVTVFIIKLDTLSLLHNFDLN